MRYPTRVSHEKAVNEANPISNEQTEAQTEQARRQCQPTGEPLTSLSHQPERRREAHRDQHHARNGAYAEDQEVSNRPTGVSDCGQDQQGYGCGTGKSVHHAYHERPKILINTDLSKDTVYPGHRRIVGRVGMTLGFMSVRMLVNVISVAVGMGVHDFRSILSWDGADGHRAQKSSDIPQTKDNQHDRNRQLHTESDPCGDCEVEENDPRADHEDCESVANAPERSDQSCPHAAALIADDGCDCNDVVGVRGVRHPDKKSNRENREKTDHFALSSGRRYGSPVADDTTIRSYSECVASITLGAFCCP